MIIGTYIFGIRKELLNGLPEEVARRQIFIYNMLGLMLIVLALLGAASGLIFGLVLFNHWGLAIACGIFLGGVFFLLLQLLLFLSLQTRYRRLKEQLSDMESLYNDYKGLNMTTISDEEALEIVSNYRLTASASQIKTEPNPFHLSQLLISASIVSLALLLSFIVASAIEIWMFRHSLNEKFYEIKHSTELNHLAKDYQLQRNTSFNQQKMEAYWTLKMVDNSTGEAFKLVHCHSLLMTFDVLMAGIGNTKVLIDLLFACVFLIPYILVKKSDEISGGELLKQVTIDAISTSLLMHLLSTREIQRVKHKIETEYNYSETIGLK
jgi:hypothetical protein